MWFGVVTLFPEMIAPFAQLGVIGRAVNHGKLSIKCWNPRDYTFDKHQTVDDRPYGGGPGMLMKIQPLRDAIHAAKQQAIVDGAGEGQVKVIYLSPQGRKLDQQGVDYLASDVSHLILVAGRYEGIDERLLEAEVDEEWSIGDFVLSGGELPALTLIDAVARLVPGVLGHELSAEQDSFVDGLLDCPHYTRPEVFEGQQVPKMLLSGNHQHIKRWRLKQSLGRTLQRRPDMLEKLKLTSEQQALLAEFKCDQENN